jgi:hypothetical protein
VAGTPASMVVLTDVDVLIHVSTALIVLTDVVVLILVSTALIVLIDVVVLIDAGDNILLGAVSNRDGSFSFTNIYRQILLALQIKFLVLVLWKFCNHNLHNTYYTNIYV